MIINWVLLAKLPHVVSADDAWVIEIRNSESFSVKNRSDSEPKEQINNSEIEASNVSSITVGVFCQMWSRQIDRIKHRQVNPLIHKSCMFFLLHETQGKKDDVD